MLVLVQEQRAAVGRGDPAHLRRRGRGPLGRAVVGRVQECPARARLRRRVHTRAYCTRVPFTHFRNACSLSHAHQTRHVFRRVRRRTSSNWTSRKTGSSLAPSSRAVSASADTRDVSTGRPASRRHVHMFTSHLCYSIGIAIRFG